MMKNNIWNIYIHVLVYSEQNNFSIPQRNFFLLT